MRHVTNKRHGLVCNYCLKPIPKGEIYAAGSAGRLCLKCEQVAAKRKKRKSAGKTADSRDGGKGRRVLRSTRGLGG